MGYRKFDRAHLPITRQGIGDHEMRQIKRRIERHGHP
jgi:hypothetical protein